MDVNNFTQLNYTTTNDNLSFRFKFTVLNILPQGLD